MKIINFLIPLIMLCMIAVSANAQKQSSGSYVELNSVKHRQGTSHRPKAPSLQRITCAYDGEYLVFDFVLPEGQCELTVRSIDNTNVVCETFDSNDLVAEVFVGNITDCEIELTTQKGNTYSGNLKTK